MESPKKILVVEDSSLLRSVVVNALGDAGFLVIEAENGKEGLDVAKREHPDLIILDLIMPVMDGMEMYQQLREDAWGGAVPVIMLSATKDDKIASWLDSNKLDFFTKDNWMMDEVVLRVQKRLRIAA